MLFTSIIYNNGYSTAIPCSSLTGFTETKRNDFIALRRLGVYVDSQKKLIFKYIPVSLAIELDLYTPTGKFCLDSKPTCQYL